jgi:ABC-type glycerol-3-phosphate transport system permease component
MPRREPIGRNLIWILVALWLVVTLFPFLWVLSLSVRTPKEVFSAILLPKTVRLANYLEAWTKFGFTTLFRNTSTRCSRT